MSRHLETQEDFTNSFKNFKRLMTGTVQNEENLCRLFDMWLANVKDERVIEEQLKKAPWEDEGGY